MQAPTKRRSLFITLSHSLSLWFDIRRVAIFIYIYREFLRRKTKFDLLDTLQSSRVSKHPWSFQMLFSSSSSSFFYCINKYVLYIFSPGWDIQYNESVWIKFRAIDWGWWQIDNMSCWKSKSNGTISGNNVEIERCL